MKTLNCPRCGKILVENTESYLGRYPNETYMQCCYCGHHFSLDKIRMEVLSENERR